MSLHKCFFDRPEAKKQTLPLPIISCSQFCYLLRTEHSLNENLKISVLRSLFNIHPQFTSWSNRNQSVLAAVADIEAHGNRFASYSGIGLAKVGCYKLQRLVCATAFAAKH